MDFKLYIAKINKLAQNTGEEMRHRVSSELQLVDVEKEYLLRFVNRSNGDVDDLILLFSLQEKYRFLFNWDQNIEKILSAAGFLCAKYQNLCDYIVNRIKYEEDGVSIKDSKYTYMFCLTIASLLSPKAMKQIMDFDHIWRRYTDDSPSNSKRKLTDLEKKHAQSLRPDGIRGYWDARDRHYKYGSASEATIKWLIGLFIKNPPNYLSYDKATVILFKLLGENNNVTCVDANLPYGSPEKIEKDFTNDVIRMFCKKPPYFITYDDGYHPLLRKWYDHNPAFRQRLTDSIEIIKPVLLKRFLSDYISVNRSYRDNRIYDHLTREGYSAEEIEKHYIQDDFIEMLNSSIKNLESKDINTRIIEYRRWESAAARAPNSIAWQMMDTIRRYMQELPVDWFSAVRVR